MVSNRQKCTVSELC